MRHKLSNLKLNRDSSSRKALFRSLANALIERDAIKTTLVKAKELRRIIEPLITKAKNASVASRRLVFARIRNNENLRKLFNELGPRYMNRPGGYTRILKIGHRPGDNAPMAYIELVEEHSTEG